MPFSVTELDNVTLFAHPYGSWTVRTHIAMPELLADLVIAFNPISNLYHEETFERSVRQPFEHAVWYISGWLYDKSTKTYKGPCNVRQPISVQ